MGCLLLCWWLFLTAATSSARTGFIWTDFIQKIFSALEFKLNMINYTCEHVNWAVSVKLSATLLLLLRLLLLLLSLSLSPPSPSLPPPPAGLTGYYVGNGLLLWIKCSSQHCPSKIWVHCIKGKAVPLQAWTGQEGSRKLRFPDFMTTAQDGGRLSALRTGCIYPQEIFLVLILLEAESTPGP